MIEKIFSVQRYSYLCLWNLYTYIYMYEDVNFKTYLIHNQNLGNHKKPLIAFIGFHCRSQEKVQSVYQNLKK